MARRPARERESVNLRAFRTLLEFRGAVVYRRNVGIIRLEYKGKRRRFVAAAAGQSDLWGFLPLGRETWPHFECEVKRPGEWPTDKQIDWLRFVNSIGHYGFWADTLDHLIRIYEGISAGRRVCVERSGDLYLE
jgi:hypothetical protein